MTKMLQFLRRKIKPFKKCTGNPSYSFEVNTSTEQKHRISRYNQSTMCQTNTNLDSEYELTGCSQTFTSKLSKSKSVTSRFYHRFRRSAKKVSMSSSCESNNDSLNNRETTNSFMTKEEPAAVAVAVFDSPPSSVSSANLQPCRLSEKLEWSDDDDVSYTNNDCINDLIDNTNFTQNYISPNNDNSMLTYNTKYANNSNMYDFEDGLDEPRTRVSVISKYQHQQQKQSTPFEEMTEYQKRTSKRQSKVLSEAGNLVEYRKHSKQYQSQNELTLGQPEQDNESPLFKKMNLKQNRKCRRSNTTFTMAGMKKNKIIDYFNNLEMTKPIGTKNHKLFASNKEINKIDVECKKKKHNSLLDDSKLSRTSVDGINNNSVSKNEVEKIQDLFFYDESLMSKNNEAEPENVTANDKHMLSTFLDSPISLATEKTCSAETTPVFRQNESSKLVKMSDGVMSTNNSVEKFRRSSSMPGLNEPNLSIQANSSKINALRCMDDDLNMNITPKKALVFDQNDMISTSIENLSNTLSTPQAAHFISSFEVSDDELPKTFVRGQSRNLSANIKQMFRNVVKLQLDALSNLEKFYEAQLLKVEADRKQNLQLNPANRERINEFFDRQLEMLEERVQINLESITKEKKNNKNRRMSSCTSLKFDQNTDDESDNESIQKISKSVLQKQLFSQKLAQIISSTQCNNGNILMQQNSRRSQSKNLMELKNNLINQKNLLPSKSILSAANQSGNDYSPKNSSMFKRNLSLPFKQCKNHQQVYRRVRNESVHEAVHLSKVQSPPSQKVSALANSFKGDSLIDCNFSYNNKSVFQYQKNSTIKHNESGDDVKRAHETSQRNMAKIVKLTNANFVDMKPKKSFVVSSNSAFKPIRREFSAQNLGPSSVELYEEMCNNEQQTNFKPISLDVRRNSSIFYQDEETTGVNCELQRRNMPMPRLSDSHLLFKIKQEKRLNDRKIMSNCYQKQFQSKMSAMPRSMSKNNFHIETEV